ncbi:hypothetical protein ACJJTC_016484 [Scirpophaga incertulas]
MVIKHFCIAGKTATEIRNILQEVHGASTPSFSTISFWKLYCPIDSLPVPLASTSISLESSRLTGRGWLGSPMGRTRSRRNLTPFERASKSFVRVEEQHLALEERREENLHVRETQRLQLESERLHIQRHSNLILERMTEVVGELLTLLRDRNL